MRIKKLSDFCPICGTKDNLGFYPCTICWTNFMHYLEKKYPLYHNENKILDCLPEYLELIGKGDKEKVEFT